MLAVARRFGSSLGLAEEEINANRRTKSGYNEPSLVEEISLSLANRSGD